MTGAIAFLPWVHIDEPLTIGSLRLLPFSKRKKPGNLAHASQADIDQIMAAYAERPSKRIKRAALVEFGDWKAGQKVEGHLQSLWKAQKLITFAALAKRQLFSPNQSYCNADNYKIVVQRYRAEDARTFAYTTRRRDGGSSNLWSSDEFSFQCPLHVTPHQIEIDIPLLRALIEHEQPPHVIEAINEFNNANTDAAEVTEYSEVVMAKAAFEWLYQTGPDVKDLVKRFLESLGQVEFVQLIEPLPLTKRWMGRYQRAANLREAWLRDFCSARGASAHGNNRKEKSSLWSGAKHLALVSNLFPLLVKHYLQAKGQMSMEQFDIERLRQVEKYLGHDPFDPTRRRFDKHPWAELDAKARRRSFAIEAKTEMLRALSD